MIYALLDRKALDQRGLSLEVMAAKMASLSVPILQYRNKIGALATQRRDLQVIRSHYPGQLIINDSIALIDEADGLHIGQEDIRAFDDDLTKAVAHIRDRIGRKLLGLSTHTYEEILQANALDLDYIGLGAYRGTSTKSDARVLGEEAFILARHSKHPVGLIGGVKLTDQFDESITYRVIGSDLYDN